MTNDNSPQQQTICIVEETIELSLEDLCRTCSAHSEIIAELVDEGVLEAVGMTPPDWRFDGRNLRRARIALRLQRDLGVNPAGAALALQLMEEIEALRSRLHAITGE